MTPNKPGLYFNDNQLYFCVRKNGEGFFLNSDDEPRVTHHGHGGGFTFRGFISLRELVNITTMLHENRYELAEVETE